MSTPSSQHLKKLLSDPTTFATTLLAIVAGHFEEEILQWDPETVRMEVDQEFQVVLSDACFNKLMAAFQLVTSDAFYKSLPDFIYLCNILDHGMVTPDVWDPADAGEIAWGITEGLLIYPPLSNDQEPFSPEIVAYIKMALDDEGIMSPPDVLRLGFSPGQWDNVQATFSEDPEMFAAIYSIEKDKSDEIDQMIRQRLRMLLQQLDSLNTNTESAESAVRTMLKTLSAADKKEQTLPTPSIF